MSINIVNLTFNRFTQEEEEKVLWESKPFGASPANEDVDQDNKKFTLNLRFPGQYFDKETQTHYNINRDYNPVTGRYIQSDPIGFDGGVNGFGYVGGMPIRLSDSSGLCIDPGGQGVRYCIDAFIPYATTMGYHGDNRTSSAYISNGHDYRARILIADYGNGLTDYPAAGLTVDSSTGESMYGSFDYYSIGIYGNTIDINLVTSNALARKRMAEWGIGNWNLGHAVPSVDMHMTIEDNGGWNVSISGEHDYFPSYEVWKYTDDYALQIYYYDATGYSPLNLGSWRQVSI